MTFGHLLVATTNFLAKLSLWQLVWIGGFFWALRQWAKVAKARGRRRR